MPVDRTEILARVNIGDLVTLVHHGEFRAHKLYEKHAYVAELGACRVGLSAENPLDHDSLASDYIFYSQIHSYSIHSTQIPRSMPL